jgi:hypothetical protein
MLKPLRRPDQMTPEEIGELLDAADLIDTWVKGVRAFAFEAAQDGFDIPGYKLVQKRAIRRWVDADVTRDALLKRGLNPEEIVTDPKLKSPAQIDKLLPKAERDQIADLWTNESSGASLVPETDKRETLDRAKARNSSAEDDFGGV